MKTIVVAGGSGFIGTHYIDRLLKDQNLYIINIDKLNYASNTISRESNNYAFIKQDICDYTGCAEIINEYNPSAVINFAAESHVDNSIKDPSYFFYNNIFGTTNLLQASLKLWHNNGRDPTFLYHQISTDEVYGTLGATGSFLESTPYDPRSPYSASKASADLAVKSYNTTYGLPTIITNCSNNYGPYQFPEKLIPVTILSIINKQNIPIYGDGSNVRDWLFVHDHIDALYKLLKTKFRGYRFNIGGGTELSNLQLVNKICDLMAKRGYDSNGLIKYVTDRPGHDFRYSVNSEYIRSFIGWSPKHSLDVGLNTTIDWYIDNYDKLSWIYPSWSNNA